MTTLEAERPISAADGDVFEISTDPADFSGVREDLESKGYTFVSAEVEMVPDTYTKIEDPGSGHQNAEDARSARGERRRPECLSQLG